MMTRAASLENLRSSNAPRGLCNGSCNPLPFVQELRDLSFDTLHYFAKRLALALRNAADILILRSCAFPSRSLDDFHAHGAQCRDKRCDPPWQRHTARTPAADANARRLRKYYLGYRFGALRSRERAQYDARPPFFHRDSLRPHVKGSARKEAFHNVLVELRVHVIDVRLKLNDIVRMLLPSLALYR